MSAAQQDPKIALQLLSTSSQAGLIAESAPERLRNAGSFLDRLQGTESDLLVQQYKDYVQQAAKSRERKAQQQALAFKAEAEDAGINPDK